MNIAFPAFLIVIFILPGILCGYSYKRGSWESPVSFGSVQTEIFRGLLIALVIHFLIISLLLPGIRQLGIFSHISIKFDSLIVYLTGWPPFSDAELKSHLNAVSKFPLYIMSYIILSNFLGLGLGYYCHKIVRTCKIDLIFNWFRFDNKWYYMLSGESMLIRNINETKEYIRRSSNTKDYLGLRLLCRKTLSISKIEEKISEFANKASEKEKQLNIYRQEREQLIKERGGEDHNRDNKKKLAKLNKDIQYIQKELEQCRSIIKVAGEFFDYKYVSLDHKFRPFLSIKKINSWFNDLEDKNFSEITCIIEQSGTPYLYWGVLDNFKFKRDSLDTLIIKWAHKRPLEVEEDEDNDINLDNWREFFDPIPGDIFIIQYDQVQTVNISYAFKEMNNTAAS